MCVKKIYIYTYVYNNYYISNVYMHSILFRRLFQFRQEFSKLFSMSRGSQRQNPDRHNGQIIVPEEHNEIPSKLKFNNYINFM